MSGTVVVYEYDGAAGAAPGAGAAVLRVHAAPAAPGQSGVRGPRTLCGRDTFAMGTAPWQPSGHPGSGWYPPEHADRICPACDDVAGGD
ncbi:hypothetical protein [Streptomyces sp. NBC_00158]|uniref:hypothetical protein n=1 Tax=Streptomyces sp. NBC_00158 TaxID=2903627 RepID=UPI003250779C